MKRINNYNINLQSSTLIFRLTARNQDSDSVRWRTNLATKILPLFREKYIIGYGYGTFARVWDDNKDIENLWDNTSEAHNDYIKIAFESGIIGLALFLLIFFTLLYRQFMYGIKNNWKNIVLIASMFYTKSFLTTCFTTHQLSGGSGLFGELGKRFNTHI
jgi:O-antigen ligase